MRPSLNIWDLLPDGRDQGLLMEITLTPFQPWGAQVFRLFQQKAPFANWNIRGAI